MKIFFNATCLEFLDYPKRISGGLTQQVKNVKDVWATFERIQAQKMQAIKHIVFVHDAPSEIFDSFRAYFTEVPAAGGIVVKEGMFLLMRRRGHWDLPKGKIDVGEDQPTAAKREVEEECGVRASILRYLTTSWHIYSHKGRWTLKPTTWYEMECLSDENLQPQHEEGITELCWCTHQEATKLLSTSFASLQEVFTHISPPKK